MPFRRELVQKIKVKGSLKLVGSGGGGLSGITNDILRRVGNRLPSAISGINTEAQNHAKQDQQGSLVALGAVECGTLKGSISVLSNSSGGLSSQSEVGTSLNAKYPMYLIRGRGEVFPIHAKALYFRKKCGKGGIFAKRASAAAPKDYMAMADGKLQAALPGIVRRNCNSAFGF